jgi:uncharacterized protein with NRDE domain
MCVLAMAWNIHPRWRLVLAGNRDELHARPSAPLQRWPEAPRVLGGKDLLSGGTWLGVNDGGGLAVVTNLRGFGPPEPGRPSRGLLASDLLTGAGRWADPAPADLAGFNPFNLIRVSGGCAAFIANRPAVTQRELVPGLYGLSNGDLDEPWPKTRQLKSRLAGWLEQAGDIEPLFEALADEGRPSDEELPSTGLDLERERLSSAVFIRNSLYGTRCSTVVRLDADGRGEIAERRFGPDGRVEGETVLAFGRS